MAKANATAHAGTTRHYSAPRPSYCRPASVALDREYSKARAGGWLRFYRGLVAAGRNSLRQTARERGDGSVRAKLAKLLSKRIG